MSEIWNEFEKIAAEQGLVTAEDESESVRKTPVRYDSLSDDALRLLYGIEPESIFDKNKSIIEIAHPETAVVGRAYDAMNAVVENLHQRQDMMAYIALKQPNGHLTQRRYVAAKQDLINALVRSAFVLDNKDETELMSLADSCAERLDKHADQLIKQALGPAAAVGVAALGAAAVALLAGGLYTMYGATTAQNVKINAELVLEALQPLRDQVYADGIYTDVEKLKAMADEIYDVKDQLAQVQSVDVAINAAQSEKYTATVNNINTRIQNYITQLQKVGRAIPSWVSKIKLVHKTSDEEKSDWWAKLTGIFEPYGWSDDETLIDRLIGQSNWMSQGSTGGLYQAIQQDVEIMRQAINESRREVQQKQTEIQSAPPPPPKPQNTQELPAPTPAPAPTPPIGVARTRGTDEFDLPNW